MPTAAKKETFSACSDPCVFFPLAAGGVYPKTRVWGSREKILPSFSATGQLRIELRRGCGNSSGKTTAGSALDYNGNTLTKVVGSNTSSFAWDFENRLSSVTLPGSGGTVSFKYDPFGRRIYKSSSVGTSVYAYDADNLIEETNASGAAVARYEPTQNIDEPLAMFRSGATSYYHADGLGSVTSLSNAAGSIANSYTYDSFGNLTASTGSLVNPFRYTARESDTETGLYYYRARYYDPAAGRFLNEDRITFSGGIDFYPYTHNNPANLFDPSGMQEPVPVPAPTPTPGPSPIPNPIPQPPGLWPGFPFIPQPQDEIPIPNTPPGTPGGIWGDPTPPPNPRPPLPPPGWDLPAGPPLECAKNKFRCIVRCVVIDNRTGSAIGYIEGEGVGPTERDAFQNGQKRLQNSTRQGTRTKHCHKVGNCTQQ
jgi:RHS repeat-associated protein